MASAIPNMQKAALGCSPCGAAAARNASTASGSTGSAPLAARRQWERSSPLRARRRARRREGVGEVGSAAHRAAERAHPLHPPRRCRGELCRRGDHQVDRPGERLAEQPDESHVVIQREPRHDHVVGVHPRPDRDAVEVVAHLSVREHHALGVGRGAARELQDGEVVRLHRGADPPSGRARAVGQIGEEEAGRVARSRLDEGGQLGVDEEEHGVGVRNPGTGLVDEGLDRCETHGQRQHHHGGAAQPGCLDRRHHGPARHAEKGDVGPRSDAGGLQPGGRGHRVVEDAAPRHGLDAVAGDEADRPRAGRRLRRLDALEQRQRRHHRSDRPRDRRVTVTGSWARSDRWDRWTWSDWSNWSDWSGWSDWSNWSNWSDWSDWSDWSARS